MVSSVKSGLSEAIFGLDERIGDLALIQKALGVDWAAITLPDSRFYVQVDWICKHWPTYRY